MTKCETFQSALLKQVEELWQTLRLTDQKRLYPARKRFMHSLQQEESLSDGMKEFLDRLNAAGERSLVKVADTLRCEFPEELPITGKIPQICQALQQNQVIVVCGSTGSGKTTQLPKAALAQGFGRSGRIGCTQPRRIAASALAQRLSFEMNTAMGKGVGYKVRFDDRTGDETVVKFMTDGILLAETRDDPDLLQYDCIILDEVHERSLNIDFLLGYMKLLLKRRKDLRLIISSATLESGHIAEFFHQAPVIEVEGRLYPIEDCYMPPDDDEDLTENVARAVEFLQETDKDDGDILVFLPGEREIRDTLDLLTGRHYRNTEILPLFGRLSAADQGRIFQRSSSRRIILATNVAETSLTIPGIRYVIDSGMVRLSRFNPKSRIQELRVEMVSRASAKQRRGRCGRLKDGICVHLYSPDDLEKASEYTDPEILRSSLAGVILQMAALKLPPIQEFPFADPPGMSHIREGLRTLEDLHAIDEEQHLTRTGWDLASFPMDPHLGRILLAAREHKVLAELIIITSFLSIQDPRERPFERASEADTAQKRFLHGESDFIGILNLWYAAWQELQQSNSALRRFCQKHFLNFKRMREWRNLIDDLWEMFPDQKTENADALDPAQVPYDAVHMALMSGLPRQLACLNPEDKQYQDMNGRSFLLFPGSALAKQKNQPKWIMSFALVETSKVFARCNAIIQPEWLEMVAPHICSKAYDGIHWDENSGFVYARERVYAGKLLIHPGRRKHYGKINPGKAREVFIREALMTGALQVPGNDWVKQFSKQFNGLKILENRMRCMDPLVDEERLYQHFDSCLPAWMSHTEAVKRDWQKTHKSYAPELTDYVLDMQCLKRKKDFPDSLEYDGVRFYLTYEFEPGEDNDGITLHVSKDELNLLPRYALEYLVPGYLGWKIDFMLRKLPKSIRKVCMPLADCIEGFLDEYRQGNIFQEQKLSAALAEFLEDLYDVEIPDPDCMEDFDTMPEYLKMKLAIHAPDTGKVMSIVRSMPEQTGADSKLSRGHRITKQYEVSGCKVWPGVEPLPEFVNITSQQSRKVYPALVDESDAAVAVQLFLDPAEAACHHAAGIFRLYRLTQPVLIKYLKNTIKIPAAMEQAVFPEDSDWRDQLINETIRKSMGGSLEKIRSAAQFEQLCEQSRDTMASVLAAQLQSLEQIYRQIQQVDKLLNRLPDDCYTADDVINQLDFLFRKGYWRIPEAVQQYPRYLKSLTVRLERAVQSPGKDQEKGRFLEPYLRKFQLVLKMDKPLETMPKMLDYFLFLEEARISAFTPEIRTLRKVSPDALEKAWKDLQHIS